MLRFLIIPALLIFPQSALSQPGIPRPEEDRLFQLFQQYPMASSDEERSALTGRILDSMESLLQEPESFEYRFDSLRKRVGILEPRDRKFRLFTWNVPLNAWEHNYYGIIQVFDRKKNACRVYRLKNRTGEIPDLLHAETGAEAWPGALYYDLRMEKDGQEVIYTLMGFNFHDRWSDKKIIEVLHFNAEQEPLFGKPIFKTPSGIQHRVIFEYSGDVAMNLRYNPDLKMIVYDHLSPIEPELAAYPRYYAPDFSYDGYRFKRGRWEYREDLDIRNR